ncbi:MAG TPA: hypothetical protein VNW71_11840 [Thermoanaerobaculia bacterium]|nr:hypothetical protein [Thermoanaerobaculia bacterium]
MKILNLLVVAALLAAQPAAGEPGPAKYDVRLLRVEPPRLAVSATLPIDGQALEMGTSRPADVPEIDAAGWPGLVANLRVSDAAGGSLKLTSAGAAGWLLEKPHSGPLKVEYEVDYQPLAARGWPAPREAAFADADHLVILGRSLFITTRESGSVAVAFDLPKGWQPVVPWKPGTSASSQDLTENLLVFTRSEPEVMTAGGFRLLVTAMGHWQAVRPDVRAVLGPVIRHFVKVMGYDEQESYSVVLLPILDRGGEAFRHSFAMSLDVPPSSANRSDWGNTIAHEVFHYWNGSRLRGADYATSQWFQEGFTEYVANVSMAVGMADPDGFRKKLSDHVANYRKLATTLEGGGTRKGPPLYSAGALVAFSWDVMIRDATGGKRNLGDFLRELWRRTDRGQRPYEWSDIQAALEATAPLDWQSFHTAHIRGDKPLPLAEIFARAGLRVGQAEDGTARVELDPAASTSAASLWKGLVTD